MVNLVACASSHKKNVLSKLETNFSAVTTSSTTSRSSSASQRNPNQQHSNYQTPASALYSSSEETMTYTASAGSSTYGRSSLPVWTVFGRVYQSRCRLIRLYSCCATITATWFFVGMFGFGFGFAFRQFF